MASDKSKFFSAEKAGVVLDIGMAYCKIGFINENTPRKILQTPKSIFRLIKDYSLETKSQLYDTISELSFKNELETFITNIFLSELLVVPRDRSVFICENYLTPRILIDYIGEILFERMECPRVYFLFSNSLPLYTTGLFTGIVVETGFFDTQITPFYEGFPLVNCFESCDAGGLKINKEIKKNFIEENKDNNNCKKKIPDYDTIENIKFKFLILPLKNQIDDYLNSDLNIEKMKKTFFDYQTDMRENLKISYYNRIISGNLLFGNNDNDESNIAYSFLKSVMKIDVCLQKKVVQNIILSGGNAQIKNFARRMRQELIYFLENNKDFKSLQNLKDYFMFTNIPYPPNCLNFIGASMIGSLVGADQFAVTSKQYFETYEKKIPDKIGKDYLLQERNEIFDKKILN